MTGAIIRKALIIIIVVIDTIHSYHTGNPSVKTTACYIFTGFIRNRLNYKGHIAR